MNGRIKLILAIVSFAVAPVLPNLKYGWPWSVNVVFSAFGFLMLGHLLFPAMQRDRELIEASRKGIVAALCVLCLSFFGTFLYKFNISESFEYVLMAEARYGNYGLFLLVSCSGIVFVLTLAMLLDIFVPIMDQFDPLAFIGQNTLLILCLHKFFIQCFKIVFRFVHVGTTLTLILTCIGTLIACFPCILFINKYIPALAGKAKPE